MKQDADSGRNDRDRTLENSLDQLDHVLQMLESREFDVCEVVNHLQENCPEAGESIIERANSPEFALRKQVARVEHAIAVLGHRRVRQTLEDIRRRDARSKPAPPHFPAPVDPLVNPASEIPGNSTG